MGLNGSRVQGEDEECVSDGGGVIKRIPIEVKPRGRLGLRSTGSNAAYSQQKPGSTRSVLSIHEENHELDKLRRQYEMYKQDKDHECAAIEKRRRRYETQYKRLNAELQTVQNTCKKLRGERDAALRAEHQAVVRASAFQQDRDVVQRQFKIYRESKEKELQALLKEKRHLETTVRSRRISLTVADDDNTTWWPDSEPSLGSLSQLNTTHLSTYELDKNDDTPYVHVNRDDWMEVSDKIDGNESTTMSNLIELCVIPTSLDNEEDSLQLTTDLADLFYQKFLEQNIIFCSTHLTFYTEGSKVIEYLRVRKSSILILYLNDSEFNFSEEFYTSCFNGFIEKTIFIVINSQRTDYQSTLSSISARLPNVEIINYGGCVSGGDVSGVCVSSGGVSGEDVSGGGVSSGSVSGDVSSEGVNGGGVVGGEPNDGEDIQVTPLEYVADVLKQRYFTKANLDEYQVDKNTCHLDICDTENPDALWDILDEQKQLFNDAIQSNCQLSFEKMYEKLSSHVLHSGPSPPLLVHSDTSNGKSLLLTKWIELHRNRTPGVIVLWYLVGSSGTSSCCAALVIRRLTFELVKLLPTSSLQSLTNDSGRVFADFPRLLEKVCNYHSNIIIILDSLDRIQDSHKLFTWLLDPLPVNCKVIISSDTVFQAWQSWHCIRIEPLSCNHARELVKNCLISDYGRPNVVDDLLDSAVTSDPSARDEPRFNPLYCVLLAEVYQSQPQIIEKTPHRNLHDLYAAILTYLDSIDKIYAKQMLLLLLNSRNGISHQELMRLLKPVLQHKQLLHLEYTMLRYRIIGHTSGLYNIYNKRVERVMLEHYAFSEEEITEAKMTLKLYFDDLISRGISNMRIADELPYLNKSLGRDTDLRENLLNLDLFLEYFKRGRCCELLDFWQYLQIDRKNMAFLYKEILDKLHSFDDKNSEIYHAIGKFLRDLSMLSYAQIILQKSLEIRESILDPDDRRIAESLHDLADLYLIQERYQIAEQLYRQALDIYVHIYGSDHCITACEMNSMANVLVKQSRITQAEPIRKKVFSIHKNCQLRKNNRKKKKNFNRNTLVVEQTLKSLDNNADLARTLNELGVLQYLQHDTQTAENLLLKSLQIREKVALPGDNNNNEVAQSLCNLAALYFDGKRFAQALPLYEKALDIRRKNFDKHHTCIMTVVKNLALCHTKLNNVEPGIQLYAELLESQTHSLSLSHPLVAATMVNLAILHSQQNNVAEARSLFERAIVIYEQLYDDSDIRLADAIKNLAVLEYKQEEFEKAAVLYKRAKKVKENVIQSNLNNNS